MNFTDEEFLDFTEALSDIFASNYLDNTQLWSWRNEGTAMRAYRYAPVPEDCQGTTPLLSGKEEIFSVSAYRRGVKYAAANSDLPRQDPGS